ncbi:MAG: flippase-like domain-containing protein [Planctomycetes bacterium]|nr:flippase-like domain-containing protein [Planctomycetota bacterium]
MPKAKTKKSKKIFLFLRIAVVTAGIFWVIVWVSRGDRWSNLTSIFHQMNLGVFAVTLSIFVIGQLIVGFRWWLLLRTQSIFINLAAAIRLNFLGWFYNNFMPGSVGGDLIRAWYVTKHTEKRFEAVLSVFVDRVIGLLSTLVIAAFFYTVFLRNQADAVTFTGSNGFFEFLVEYKWIILSVIMVLVVIFCGLLLHRRGRTFLQKAWFQIKIHSLRVFEKLKNAVFVYAGSPLTILAVFVLTVSLQIMIITSFWFLGKNLGIPTSLKYYYVFFTLTWVLGALPISVGGAVVVEGTLAYLFIRYAGVEKEAAFALVLCQRIIWILASLPGAVIHLVGAHLPKDFFVDYDKPVV